jgi:hypothetical protein
MSEIMGFILQNNRNPYIDHPEYVQQIWSSTSDSQAPTAPKFTSSGTTDTTTTLSWTASADNLATGYEISGTTLKEPTLELHIPLRA